MEVDFIIVGAQKSGTTWLHRVLRRHPKVCVYRKKEIHYFDRNWEKDVSWYYSHFSHCGEEKKGEATVTYMSNSHVPKRIHDEFPKVKLVACLRYPTDRAYSNYWMTKRKGILDKGFKEVVKNDTHGIISRSLYGTQIERFLKIFRREQIKILISENMFSNPSEELNKLTKYIGIRGKYYQGQKWLREKVNKSSGVRSKMLKKALKGLDSMANKYSILKKIKEISKYIGITDAINLFNKKRIDYPSLSSGIKRCLDLRYKDTVKKIEDIKGRKIKAWRKKSCLSW